MARTHPLPDEATALDQSHLATRQCLDRGEVRPKACSNARLRSDHTRKEWADARSRSPSVLRRDGSEVVTIANNREHEGRPTWVWNRMTIAHAASKFGHVEPPASKGKIGSGNNEPKLSIPVAKDRLAG